MVMERTAPAQSTDPAVEAELDRLATMPIVELRLRYRELFRTDPPKAFGPDLLRRSSGHRIQEKAYGGLSRSAQRLLDQMMKAYPPNNAPRSPRKPRRRAGRNKHLACGGTGRNRPLADSKQATNENPARGGSTDGDAQSGAGIPVNWNTLGKACDWIRGEHPRIFNLMNRAGPHPAEPPTRRAANQASCNASNRNSTQDTMRAKVTFTGQGRSTRRKR
jgi:hypothetical protein